MFTAMEMIPWGRVFLERNIRVGGYQSQDAAERAVLKKGTGFVLQDGHIIVAAMNGRLIRAKDIK